MSTTAPTITDRARAVTAEARDTARALQSCLNALRELTRTAGTPVGYAAHVTRTTVWRTRFAWVHATPVADVDDNDPRLVAARAPLTPTARAERTAMAWALAHLAATIAARRALAATLPTDRPRPPRALAVPVAFGLSVLGAFGASARRRAEYERARAEALAPHPARVAALAAVLLQDINGERPRPEDVGPRAYAMAQRMAREVLAALAAQRPAETAGGTL